MSIELYTRWFILELKLASARADFSVPWAQWGPLTIWKWEPTVR